MKKLTISKSFKCDSCCQMFDFATTKTGLNLKSYTGEILKGKYLLYHRSHNDCSGTILRRYTDAEELRFAELLAKSNDLAACIRTSPNWSMIAKNHNEDLKKSVEVYRHKTLLAGYLVIEAESVSGSNGNANAIYERVYSRYDEQSAMAEILRNIPKKNGAEVPMRIIG